LRLAYWWKAPGRNRIRNIAGINARRIRAADERDMTVKVYEQKNAHDNWIARFLTRHRVNHQFVTPEEVGVHRCYLRPAAAIEVDGELFVNPNEDALKKLLQLG
jgi:hypothetical protein